MGLGNISISENYPEVSKDEMLAKLDVLKEPFLNNFNPDIKERIDRIKRVQALVEENFDDFLVTFVQTSPKKLAFSVTIYLLRWQS